MNKRKEGFIVLDEVLGVSPSNWYYFGLLNSRGGKTNTFELEKHASTIGNTVLSFYYEGEKYYYKYDADYNPYNELVVSLIAKDLKIPCVKYDLAIFGSCKGLISKDYRVKGASYLSGGDIINDYFTYLQYNNLISPAEMQFPNNLQFIWEALEYRYKDRENKQDIVRVLMDQIIKMFILDTLTLQVDRHSSNWEVVEYDDGRVKLQPLFDNIRIAKMDSEDLYPKLLVTEDFENLELNIQRFLRISSEEFSNILKDSIWVIKEDNLDKIFAIIEENTGYPMPDSLKSKYKMKFNDYYSQLVRIINIAEVKGGR